MSSRNILTLLLPALLLFSCGKYEEGPNFSLRTKKSRLVGEWKLVSFNDGNEILFFEDSFASDFGECGVHTEHKKIEKQQQVVWDFESDNDVKQRYNLVEKSFNYGDSYSSSSCVPVYDIKDSSAVSEELKWFFENEKQELRISVENGPFQDYQIIRLTNEELKLEDVGGNILVFEKDK